MQPHYYVEVRIPSGESLNLTDVNFPNLLYSFNHSLYTMLIVCISNLLPFDDICMQVEPSWSYRIGRTLQSYYYIRMRGELGYIQQIKSQSQSSGRHKSRECAKSRTCRLVCSRQQITITRCVITQHSAVLFSLFCCYSEGNEFLKTDLENRFKISQLVKRSLPYSLNHTILTSKRTYIHTRNLLALWFNSERKIQ